MIKEAGAEYVIIGHSERRTLFGETDATVNRKTIAAIGASLTPIVCIGETLEQRERNETMDVLDRQIKGGLDGLTGDQVAALVHRVRAGVGDRHRAHRHPGAGRRGACAHPLAAAPVVRRHGGRPVPACSTAAASSPTTSRDLMAQPDVDGALVGGASLDVRAFYDIIARSRPARYNRGSR